MLTKFESFLLNSGPRMGWGGGATQLDTFGLFIDSQLVYILWVGGWGCPTHVHSYSIKKCKN